MTVTKRTRFEVLRRDGHRCRYCGRNVDDGATLTVDHVVPTALGGSDDPSNLVAACRDCNAGKASTGPDEHTVAQVSEDALRWARAIRMAAAEHQAEREHVSQVAETVRYDWTQVFFPHDPLPGDWPVTVETFVRAGLDHADLEHAILRTNDVDCSRKGLRDPWAYFCSVCWSTIRQRQDRAAELLDQGLVD